MLQRFFPALPLALLLSGLVPGESRAQSASPLNQGRTVFQANARIVVLDVVVSGKNLRPVSGLQRQDFLVTENGKPQAITSFEEHTGAPPPAANAPDLEPNVFTNVPRAKPSESVTVLLLDSLNTPIADQSFVRAQTLKYLQRLEPGQRIAIFTLGSELHFVQGFTDDPALLIAAINNRKNGVATQTSPLLQTHAETAANEEVVAALAEVHAEDAAAAMQQFLTDQAATRSGIRLKLTLDALQKLALYLAGVPGRKNLVWFSGAFPVVVFPNPDLRNAFSGHRDDQAEVRKTDALLAASQVAVYPIAAEGLATDSIYSASVDARQAQQPIIQPGRDDTRNADHAAMDQIARGTGGTAFYNTNGLTDALDRVAEHAAYFYTLTYTSNNAAADGRFRKIQVALAANPGYQLAYRRGYYADDAKKAQTATAQPTAPADPLLRFLRPGLPVSTQIPLTLRVVRGSASPVAVSTHDGPAQGGDNLHLKGPLTRYRVDFMVPARGLHFDIGPDGNRHVRVETALLVFDHQGKPLNWMFRQLTLNLDAARYQAAQTTGINLYMEIDAPSDATLLRSGVYDLNADLAGTLEIPLRTVTSTK